jgi:hypothetical protein
MERGTIRCAPYLGALERAILEMMIGLLTLLVGLLSVVEDHA